MWVVVFWYVSISSLTANPLDDFFLLRCRRLLVGVKLHRVARSALCARAEIVSVAKHLRQRHEGVDDLVKAALLGALHLAAAGVDVTNDVAEVVVGGRNLDGHHGLKKLGLCLASRFTEPRVAGDLERHF